jgi:hypothetical protein
MANHGYKALPTSERASQARRCRHGLSQIIVASLALGKNAFPLLADL